MYKEFLGNGMIDPIMHDRYSEDISCDGVNVKLFVYHTRYESMRTNLRYRNAVELDSFVTKLAQRSGKYISIAEPMLDSTMHDSRIQMTLGTEVTAHGSTYTIRKFKSEPITPTDLIEWSTFSPLSIAFFWLAVESGKSCIFAGGTASVTSDMYTITPSGPGYATGAAGADLTVTVSCQNPWNLLGRLVPSLNSLTFTAATTMKCE